jgi:hypothetical protein
MRIIYNELLSKIKGMVKTLSDDVLNSPNCHNTVFSKVECNIPKITNGNPQVHKVPMNMHNSPGAIFSGNDNQTNQIKYPFNIEGDLNIFTILFQGLNSDKFELNNNTLSYLQYSRVITDEILDNLRNDAMSNFHFFTEKISTFNNDTGVFYNDELMPLIQKEIAEERTLRNQKKQTEDKLKF